MELQAFLEAVVPSGTIVLAKRVEKTNEAGERYSTFSHSCVKTHAAAAERITELCRGNEDVYFALAAYRQGFHVAADGRRVVRVRANVLALQALWLDLDYKEYGGSRYDGLRALRAFLQASDLPAPAILVESGNGLHVYWPLSAALDLEPWQRLADALKQAARHYGLKADLGCTGDPCRVLRPPGSTNWKDPTTPKPVKILYSNGESFTSTQLEEKLTLHLPSKPIHSPAYDELSGGLEERTSVPSTFAEIAKHCAVARHAVDSHGSDASEPEWVAMLQLLRRCTDGQDWVHAVSDGHPGYVPAHTDRKWAARPATTGPTLCRTFEQYRSQLCEKCPHNGFVKSPIQLGTGVTETLAGLPPNWRVAADNRGIERLMIIDGGEGRTTREWVFAMRHIPSNVRVTRSVSSGSYDVSMDVTIKGSVPWSVTLPGGTLGNSRKLSETLADRGMLFKGNELKGFLDLMSTWLARLQSARRVADVTEQLGWLTADNKIVGFSAGPTTFYSDGRTSHDVRAAREFSAVAKLYETRGDVEAWKKVARFIAEQNNPAFTAILAAAFGAPLLRFTGQAGAVLSIVSSASGVGKSSALKVSQAVWGSPTHGVNAVDDTPKSVARKLGFLNNLPVFWDELRGKKTVEDFVQLAFTITQGKERSRLDSSAALRDVSTWETMVVVASNESIFEAMGRQATGSDAGVVRCFEMFVEPFASDRNRAELAVMFEQLNHNYGGAGRIYAQHLATHAGEVEAMVNAAYSRLAKNGSMEASERFWFAVVTVLMVGAQLARQLDLVQIDLSTLGKFLMTNIMKLRARTTEVNSMSSGVETLAAFMQAYQDRALMLDKFAPSKLNAKNYIPEIIGGTGPRNDKLVYVVSRDDKEIRFPYNEFTRFLEHRSLPVYSTINRMRVEFNMTDIRTKLGLGTKWVLPATRCFRVKMDDLDSLFARQLGIKADGSLSPADSSDLSSDSRPED